MKHGEIPRDSLSGVVGLILAAGASTRMRPLGNKLTQLIDDERRLVSVPIDAMHEAGIDLVFVVLGSDAESLRAFLRDRPLSYVFNPEWEMGLGSSIAAGVRGILELHRPKAIMVCLGDLPGLRAE
ncbi:MAG: NTP transferase domain-containing protein, partial [Phycisphaeraceae bacterium]|nr:NTP transferase domain-containing protein [Phycisphaeraceae bacterium]